MKVSVSLITYNHEEFVAKALDSVLMQKTDFDYEIVIGEDCSTDNTRNIIIDYQKRYPDKLRLLLNEKNLGAYNNIVQVLDACKGKYVAFLEGDDYWTSPDKLQKQVDYLESHPECVLCFHNVEIIYKDGSDATQNYCPADQKEISTVEDLLIKNFIPTCSKMYRNGLLADHPHWFSVISMGDWPSSILLALHGNIGYINENMGAYIIHSSGAWSNMRQDRKAWYKADIQLYEILYHHLEPKFKDIIYAQTYNRYMKLLDEYEMDVDINNAKACLIELITKYHKINKNMIKRVVKLYFPRLFSAAKTMLGSNHHNGAS